MLGMVLETPRGKLIARELPQVPLRTGQLRIQVEACGVCRTDLHLVDGELPQIRYPIIPGHEVVGLVEEVSGGSTLRAGDRVGLPWLGSTCGCCSFCRSDRENLCDAPVFTGYTRDGGFATHVLADAGFVIPLGAADDPVATAPLLCAGLIGWRSLVATGSARRIGIYGFGAAAHILTQICVWQQRSVFAFTRAGDEASQRFARELGATWAGSSDERPPEALDAAIIFAPAGELVPRALAAVAKGGKVVCGGIHMTDIPSFPYRLLWEERELVSIANLTRADARTFFPVAREARVRTQARRYPLASVNEALADLRDGRIQGAAVLVP